MKTLKTRQVQNIVEENQNLSDENVMLEMEIEILQHDSWNEIRRHKMELENANKLTSVEKIKYQKKTSYNKTKKYLMEQTTEEIEMSVYSRC
jgi:uncharacterized phage-like protein YoqJ